MTEKQDSLKLLLEGAYNELIHVVNAVPAGSLEVKITHEWSVKDILGHIVSWGDEYRREIGIFRENPMAYYGYIINKEYQYYEWNQAQAAEKAKCTWRQIRMDLDRDRNEMMTLVGQTSDQEFDIFGVVPWKLQSVKPRPAALTRENSCTIQEMLAIHARHIKHHAEIIARSRKDPGEDLFDAVKHNRVSETETLLNNYPTLIHARDEAGATPLHYATLLHHQTMIRVLIQAGANLNTRDHRHGATPLDWAIKDLRKEGALLATEVEDAVQAIQEKNILWARQLITRWPALKEASDIQGRPLAAHAEASEDNTLISLFRDNS